MGKGTVDCQITIHAPISDVFDRLIDHEAMAKWPGIGDSRLVKDGRSTRNGLGAIRRVKVSGLTLDEEVVHCEAPVAFDYAIIRGVPVDHHRGQVRLSETGGGVHVTWSVRLSSRIPLFAQLMAFRLRRGLPKALAYVKAELERPLRSSDEA